MWNMSSAATPIIEIFWRRAWLPSAVGYTYTIYSVLTSWRNNFLPLGATTRRCRRHLSFDGWVPSSFFLLLLFFSLDKACTFIYNCCGLIYFFSLHPVCVCVCCVILTIEVLLQRRVVAGCLGKLSSRVFLLLFEWHAHFSLRVVPVAARWSTWPRPLQSV